MLTEVDIILRIIISSAIGLLIGLSRRRKAAGIRTFALFALGCTIFTIVSISDVFGPDADKGRIIGQVVSGIGFLGLGVIWKQGAKPTGLTTAAAIWVTAGIGVLIGLGMWLEVAIGTLLTLVIVYSKIVLSRMGYED
ncbi:MAG TPA: MgtC/SapB family protein [Candidatus Bilamarchaeum sp.]|nr:MgtC/SapB family protein [Candidatus Bilamarchaeum sp.]